MSVRPQSSIAAFAMAGAVMLAGCSTVTTNPAATAEPSQTQSESTWALPLDPYLPPTLGNSYARKLLMRQCLAAVRIDFEVAPVDIDAEGPLTANSAGRRLFDVTLAKEYGYHPAPTARFNRDLARAIGTAPVQAGELGDRDRCQSEADATLPTLDDLASRLAYSVDVVGNGGVVSAVARWSACISDQGLEPSDDPTQMPGDSLSARFGLDNPVDLLDTTASQDEIDIATIDAGCRESSGYSSAVYSAEWNAQNDFLEANTADSMAAYATNLAADLQIRKIISGLEKE